MAKPTKRALRRLIATDNSKPARIRRLTTLGYMALVIGVRRAHLSDGWMRHFKARSDRLFSQANREWAHA